MKVATILGTRPQYIKFKPLYDYFKKIGCDSIVADTNQHYTKNISSVFVEEFGFDIDFNLKITDTDFGRDFFSFAIDQVVQFLMNCRPDIVVVIGDTNSTLIAALAAKRCGIKIAHIEAGIRCGSVSRPEEVNRVVVDELSDIHFTARKEDDKNVKNPIYVGDLELFMLNEMDRSNKISTRRFDDFLLMTIHRRENATPDRIKDILKYCEEYGSPLIFPIHHTTKRIIEENSISIPKNIQVTEPKNYIEILELMSSCKGIFTDSGGIIKTSPFFGKKCLVPLEVTEYDDLVKLGYSEMGTDFSLFNSPEVEVNKTMYYVENTCEIIFNFLKNTI